MNSPMTDHAHSRENEFRSARRGLCAIALAFMFLILASGAAPAQTNIPSPENKCFSLIFDDTPDAGRFPMTTVYYDALLDLDPDQQKRLGSNLNVVGSARDAISTTAELKPKNFSITNNLDESIHVRMRTRDCAFYVEFDLPRRGSFYDTVLPLGIYSIDIHAERRQGFDFGVFVSRSGIAHITTVYGNGGPQRWSQFVKYSYYIVEEPKNRISDTSVRVQASDGSVAVPTAVVQAAEQAAVRQEIARIRNGPHEAMPVAQAAPSSLGGQTGMSVKNGTSCALTVFVSGPASQSVQLAPGGSQTLSLAPGNYELAASVSCPNVIPFYGTQTLSANTQYSENFYIASK